MPVFLPLKLEGNNYLNQNTAARTLFIFIHFCDGLFNLKQLDQIQGFVWCASAWRRVNSPFFSLFIAVRSYSFRGTIQIVKKFQRTLRIFSHVMFSLALQP